MNKQTIATIWEAFVGTQTPAQFLAAGTPGEALPDVVAGYVASCPDAFGQQEAECFQTYSTDEVEEALLAAIREDCGRRYLVFRSGANAANQSMTPVKVLGAVRAISDEDADLQARGWTCYNNQVLHTFPAEGKGSRLPKGWTALVNAFFFC